MDYTPTDYVLTQDAFVNAERARHVRNVMEKYKNIENSLTVKEHKPKKATRKEIKEMASWGVKKVENMEGEA